MYSHEDAFIEVDDLFVRYSHGFQIPVKAKVTYALMMTTNASHVAAKSNREIDTSIDISTANPSTWLELNGRCACASVYEKAMVEGALAGWS